jgi:hypothetical protein
MLILRGKEGDRVAKRKISRNKEEFIKIVDEFELMRKPGERIYSSVNSRDMNKAIREFKRRSLEADYYDQNNKEDFYYDIQNRWISCIMSPNCKAESNFLIDIDNVIIDDLDISLDISIIKEHLEQIKTEILFEYPTKNGYHIITNPFNPALWNDEFGEIKKDSLILISF